MGFVHAKKLGKRNTLLARWGWGGGEGVVRRQRDGKCMGSTPKMGEMEKHFAIVFNI